VTIQEQEIEIDNLAELRSASNITSEQRHAEHRLQIALMLLQIFAGSILITALLAFFTPHPPANAYMCPEEPAWQKFSQAVLPAITSLIAAIAGFYFAKNS
jgi:hypothetical protein